MLFRLRLLIVAVALVGVFFWHAPGIALGATTVSGTVYGNNGDTLKGATVSVGIPPDQELSATSGDKGLFSITIPSSISIPSTGLRVSIGATFQGAQGQVTNGPYPETIKPNQDNPFPSLLRLGVPGNSASSTGPGGPITSPDISAKPLSDFGIKDMLNTISGFLDPAHNSSDIGTLFRQRIALIIDLMLALSGAIAVLMGIMAGYMYLTAYGNEERATQAKKTIFYLGIGLAMVLSVWTIVQIFASFAQGNPVFK